MKNKGFPKVQLRGGFSDRNGIRIENKEMQYRSLDNRTRVSLINAINMLYHANYENNYHKQQLFLRYILFEVYMQKVDFDNAVSYNDDKIFEIINGTILEDEYDSVLTLVEYIAQKMYENSSVYVFDVLNSVFKKEYVGYRFVNKIIVNITDDTEIETINEAIQSPYETVNSHISKAIALLADRDKPDYENSIKESISAVEAMCVLLLGKGATLGAALKQLEKNGLTIHPSMRSAFEKLYGYTSDACGIRHAGDIGGSSSTFEEAKFMLVSCSAFVNYLISVSATYGK